MKKELPIKHTPLSITDRFLVISSLPTTGSFLALGTIKFLRKKLELSKDEQKTFMKSFEWDSFQPSDEAKVEKKFDLSAAELNEIKRGLHTLDDLAQATPPHLELYMRLFPETFEEWVEKAEKELNEREPVLEWDIVKEDPLS